MQKFTFNSSQPFAANRRSASIQDVLFSIWPYRFIRSVIAAIFLWSGLTKIVDPSGFALIIEAYGLIPETWVVPVAVGLPVLELLAGVGLLLDVPGSLALVTGLLACFIAILGYGIILGLDVDCGCFGPEEPEAKIFHGLRRAFYRDLLILAGIVYLYVWRYARTVKPVRWTIFYNANTQKENG
jgi:uncharacterized membrane protein YphA (DoxX/SURF4 family)